MPLHSIVLSLMRRFLDGLHTYRIRRMVRGVSLLYLDLHHTSMLTTLND
jgi:hypothetical protein